MVHECFDPIHALHTDAKRYPGGIKALAQLIGRSEGVLHNKFSSATDAEVMDREADAMALAIVKATGSTGYIEHKCGLHGGLFVQLPDEGEAADDDILSALLDGIRAFGDMARELQEARGDGVISHDEFAAISLRARRLQSHIQQTMARLRTQVVDIPTLNSFSVQRAGA